MNNELVAEEDVLSPRFISLKIALKGEPETGEYTLLVVFNGQIVLDGKWINETVLESQALPLNLRDKSNASLLGVQPLIFLLRSVGAKSSKEPDPLLSLENKAGATVDLLPLVLGEEKINVLLELTSIDSGRPTGLCIDVIVNAGTGYDERAVLTLTMISGHCFPQTKEGTVYISAIALDELTQKVNVKFGMSLSSRTAKKLTWSTASALGPAGCAATNVPDEDTYFPPEFTPADFKDDCCNSAYWFSMTRVLVDPLILKDRLKEKFYIEVAGIPKVGKIEARGRYLGFVDASVLLEPGQTGVTTSTQLRLYSEAEIPSKINPLLDFSPTSAKGTVREGDVTDEMGHPTFVRIRFDITEPLAPKAKISSLFETIGYRIPEGPPRYSDELYVEPPPEDSNIDVRRIRKECGALKVHKELGALACRGSVPMNQSIKRTAANKLLTRIRNMLRQFTPEDMSDITWRDTITAQHAACRLAVSASFAAQPPQKQPPPRFAASRARIAGDIKLADKHMNTSLNVAPKHPRTLIVKALRCLEARVDSEAKKCIVEALGYQTRNKFLLWIFGSQEFDKGKDSLEKAIAALRIAVKGDISDGTANAVGWAALHAIYHYDNNPQAAFVAAKKMRKAYELPKDWKGFLQRWRNTSGEEECLWLPRVVSSENPLIISAAFFLCLRGYKFSELLLQCFEGGCGTRGSRFDLKTVHCADLYYLRGASLLLRRKYEAALDLTDEGIKKFGPCRVLCQFRTVCMMCINGWDGECESALTTAERLGAEPFPHILLTAALNGMSVNPRAALQRAVRAHKMAPSAYSALAIGRIYAKMNEKELAQRWAAAAVNIEPYYADGWAFLALFAMYARDKDKARTLMRTANQVGVVSSDIQEEVKRVSAIVGAEGLPETMSKDVCFCYYYND